MTLPLKHILEKMDRICAMPEKLKVLLYERIERIEVPKNKILLKPGELCNYYYYIEKGILSCEQWKDNKVSYPWLMFSGDIATSVDSFNYRSKSAETIRAVTNCTLYLLHWKHVEDFRHEFFSFADIRDYFSNYYASQAWTIIAQSQRPPEEFYEFLVDKYGDELSHVPRKMLATFMGISAASLYTIIKNYQPKKGPQDN